MPSEDERVGVARAVIEDFSYEVVPYIEDIHEMSEMVSGGLDILVIEECKDSWTWLGSRFDRILNARALTWDTRIERSIGFVRNAHERYSVAMIECVHNENFSGMARNIAEGDVLMGRAMVAMP